MCFTWRTKYCTVPDEHSFYGGLRRLLIAAEVTNVSEYRRYVMNYNAKYSGKFLYRVGFTGMTGETRESL